MNKRKQAPEQVSEVMEKQRESVPAMDDYPYLVEVATEMAKSGYDYATEFLFGLDLIFNFWASLFSGNIGAFFDREFFYSERAGTWGWRSDGVIGKITGGRAFSYQHQIVVVGS